VSWAFRGALEAVQPQSVCDANVNISAILKESRPMRWAAKLRERCGFGAQ
jgi:hypothetical protein